MNSTNTGTCLCGEVSFEVKGVFDSFFLCHCTHCQKDTGSAHASNLFSTTATLNWLAGENNVQTYQLPDSRHVKSFCKTCGSALPNVQMDGQLLVVPAGCLDTKIAKTPNAHIFVASKAQWDKDLEKVQKFDELPS